MRQIKGLAINDISCVGRCSLTVALPIISSMGIECSILPTAVLSTHTGGFSGYTFLDLDKEIRDTENSLATMIDELEADEFDKVGLLEFKELLTEEKKIKEIREEK